MTWGWKVNHVAVSTWDQMRRRDTAYFKKKKIKQLCTHVRPHRSVSQQAFLTAKQFTTAHNECFVAKRRTTAACSLRTRPAR